MKGTFPRNIFFVCLSCLADVGVAVPMPAEECDKALEQVVAFPSSESFCNMLKLPFAYSCKDSGILHVGMSHQAQPELSSFSSVVLGHTVAKIIKDANTHPMIL